jgi:hypothetical protein
MMGMDRDGSKLLENCVKMIGEPQTKGKQQLEKLQYEILDKIINIPM